jgi:predicted transcriptional regulator
LELIIQVFELSHGKNNRFKKSQPPPNADANQRVALQNTEQLHLIPSKLLFPHRIQIMQMLTSNESVKFKQIGEATGLSNGNLWSHIRALEADGLMAINKEVNGRKVKLKLYVRMVEGVRCYCNKLKQSYFDDRWYNRMDSS